jgi:threonylcarbamoyladenosine tRNA methylthiotransferase MtaB
VCATACYIRYYTSVSSFYVENFGCRATQADGAALERQFAERGLERANSPNQAQLVILNTCTVTAAADQDARAAVRRIHRVNPECQIIVTGCYAQRAPEEIAALPGVASVIGNSHKHRLAELALHRPAATGTGGRLHATDSAFVPLHRLVNGDRLRENDGFPATDDQSLATDVHVSDIFAHTELLAAPVFDAANERTRPNLKVQDGCDNRCSFCVIPYVRGQSRSLNLDVAIREVQQLVAAGYREVVISGINLGRWGRDLSAGISPRSSVDAHRGHAFGRAGLDGAELAASAAGVYGRDNGELRTGNRISRNNQRRTIHNSLSTDERRLTTLVRSILDQTSLEKLRISSVEPMDWSDELINLVASSPRIAKHAHVPMQSGSDRILRAMHRKYRPWHYREKIEKIRAAMPSAAIGADVMVGFPGESDADFEETRRMVEELPLTYLHVFTYSARPGTPAASLPNQIPVAVARERNRILRELASQKKLAFMTSFVGKVIQAITLNVFDGEFTEALTDNYLKLRLAGNYHANQWIEARVDGVVDGILLSR